MINLSFNRLIFVLAIVMAGISTSYGQNQVEGNAVRIIDNRKDIYHDKNEIHRKILIKEVILDAIEKGADVSVKNLISYNVESVSIDNYEQNFEQFVSKTLQEYHVNWNRTSQFIFSRDNKKKKKWHCRVEGQVVNLDFNPADFYDDGNSTINGSSYNTFYITRKSFGKVHINAGIQDGVNRGDKFIVQKYLNKKSLAGINQVKKTKAHIYVTEVGDDFAIGNIVKGYYRHLKRNQVSYGTFNLNRGGFKYELFLQEEKLNITEFGINKEVTLDITSHAISFAHWSYLSKWGGEIGLDVMDLKADGISDIALNPKIGGFRNINIIPELVYIQPKIHLGMMFVNFTEELFEGVTQDDLILTFEVKLGAMFSLYAIDFSAGMSYRYVYSLDKLSNYYPYFGIGYNLYR